MFEILPPAYIIERNVLITLTWQLLGLPETNSEPALILNRQGKSPHCFHRETRLPQHVLNRWVNMQGPHELGLPALWHVANALATKAPMWCFVWPISEGEEGNPKEIAPIITEALWLPSGFYQSEAQFQRARTSLLRSPTALNLQSQQGLLSKGTGTASASVL